MKLHDLFEKTINSHEELPIELEKLGFNQLKTIGNEVSILTQPEATHRRTVLKQVDHEFDNAKYNPSTLRSSIGHVDIDYPNSKKKGFVTAKPLNRQGDSSAGVDNELKLANQISKALAIANPITVVFNAPGKQKIIKNVTDVVVKGRQTTNHAKADIVLKTKGQDFPISIKKNNAEYWESADSYEPARKISNQIIKKLESTGQVSLTNQGSFYYLIPSIAFPASAEEKSKMAFGTDILGNGAVISQSFEDDNFEWDDSRSTLKIKVSEILDSEKDLTDENDVWFIVRNDSNRRTRGFYPGLRILACKPKRLTQGVMLVSRSGKVIRPVDSKTVTKLIRRGQITSMKTDPNVDFEVLKKTLQKKTQSSDELFQQLLDKKS
jgi:hypothetical protein